MKTLILSCNTGEGHNACARAIKEYYDAVGEECFIMDSLSFVSEEVSKIVAKGHILIYRKFSPVFEWGYEFAQNHPKHFDQKRPIYQFFAQGAEALWNYIVQNRYDSIICTHPFAALMITEVRRRCGLTADTAFVATDYTCCPGVNCSDMGIYFIPDAALTAEFIEQKVPAEKLCPSGIPIRQVFYSEEPKVEAKKSFGVDPNHKHIVMACGSMGCGPIESLSETIEPLLGGSTELTIVCGTNERLEASMRQIHANESCIHVRGFVKNMSLLLDSADVYVTKPGGLSITEAMAKAVPMVLVNAVGGCESYNLNHLLQLKQAVTGDSIEELAEICVQAAKNWPHDVPPDGPGSLNGAKIIYETMKKRNLCYEANKEGAACTTG